MNLSFLEHYKPLFDNYRYKICLSGRASGKSVHIAIALIWYASRATIKVLCARQFMASISESSKAQIEQVIRLSGTIDSWDIKKTEIVHKITGSRFIFRGLGINIASIKSLTDVDICWVEECQDVTKESLDALIPTIRKPNSQIIISGNPKTRSEAVSQMFIENEPPPSTVIIDNSYLENPFASKELIAEAEHMKATNLPLYNHIYGGQYLDTADMQIVRSVVTGHGKAYPNDKVYVGVDCARSGGDATCIFVRKGRNIVMSKEIYNVEIDKLTHELQSIIYKHKPAQINIDSTGHGAWAADALKGQGIIVKPINFAEAARKDDRYANVRSELYGLANDYFDNGGTIPDNDHQLIKELDASKYTLDAKNRIKMIGKDEIKKIIGRSPDRADAFVLSLYTGQSPMFEQESLSGNVEIKLVNRQLEAMGSWG